MWADRDEGASDTEASAHVPSTGTSHMTLPGTRWGRNVWARAGLGLLRDTPVLEEKWRFEGAGGHVPPPGLWPGLAVGS